MFDVIFQWIQNLVFFLVIVTAVLEMLPQKSYHKYVRFYTGMVLILLLASPILKLFGAENLFRDNLKEEEYEQMLREMEWQQQYFSTEEFMDFLDAKGAQAGQSRNAVQGEGQISGQESDGNVEIKVEEIRIGSEVENISEPDGGER